MTLTLDMGYAFITNNQHLCESYLRCNEEVILNQSIEYCDKGHLRAVLDGNWHCLAHHNDYCCRELRPMTTFSLTYLFTTVLNNDVSSHQIPNNIF